MDSGKKSNILFEQNPQKRISHVDRCDISNTSAQLPENRFILCKTTCRDINNIGSVGGLAGDGGGGYGDHGVAGVAAIISTAATQKSKHLLPCGEWRDLHQPIDCMYICFQTTSPILFDFFVVVSTLRSFAYESIATVGEIRVWWRADFQSGSRVLKKGF